jgi:uncharacterized membrane protein
VVGYFRPACSSQSQTQSNTTISKPDIRGTVLWHAVMSFVYDTLIIAVTINVIAGLSR